MNTEIISKILTTLAHPAIMTIIGTIILGLSIQFGIWVMIVPGLAIISVAVAIAMAVGGKRNRGY